MEQQPAEFYERVRQGYRDLAAREPNRIVLVDGSRNADEVENEIWAMISARFPALEAYSQSGNSRVLLPFVIRDFEMLFRAPKRSSICDARTNSIGLRTPIDYRPHGSGKQQLAADLASLVNGTPATDVFSAKAREIFIARPESKSRRIVIEQIRDLEHTLQMRASNGRRKVAIIQMPTASTSGGERVS